MNKGVIYMKRRFGDRKDGYRLRKADPFFRIIPHIMKERSDAQVFFEDRIYLEETHKFIRSLRKEGYSVGFLHVVIAVMVRVISQKPKINRFVVGKKTYARNEISFSLAVKKDMSEDSEETTIKIKFDAKDTIYEVIERVNKAINENKNEESENNTDIAARVLTRLPNFMLSFAMGTIKFLDNRGMLPRFLTELSPFHSSVFITDVGSIGIRPVYHHIYNLGTNTIFFAFGTRSKEQVVEEDMTVTNRKAMDIKIVADERVVDGYYFAGAIKLAKKMLTKPHELMTPPEQVVIDNEI